MCFGELPLQRTRSDSQAFQPESEESPRRRKKTLSETPTPGREHAKKFGAERRSEITSDEGEFTIEDLIAEEDMVITISHSGYIKRTSVSTYRKQRRGGRGLSGQGSNRLCSRGRVATRVCNRPSDGGIAGR